MPHEPGTAAPQGTAGPTGVASLAGAADPAMCGRTCPVPRPRSQSAPSRVHNLDERD
jgi:hypothetical protein